MAAVSGVRRTTIAQVSGVSQSVVSRLATGRSRAPGIVTVRALCDALGVPRSWAGLADQRQEEDPTKRRQLLALGAATAVSAVVGATEDAEADLLGQGTAALRRLEQTTPTRMLLSAATAHARLVAAARARARGPRETARLAAREAEAMGLLAWLYVDLDDSAQARGCYRAAVEAAERTRDPLPVVPVPLLPGDLLHAIEFRHSSWFVDETAGLLRRFGVAFCSFDMVGLECPLLATAPFAYVRFHGSEALYASNYTDEMLEGWAVRLGVLAREVDDVYVYFNNDAEGYAVANALTLGGLLGAGPSGA